ncbi:MAG TPA: DUF5916 domain-containing protein [Longimicrobiales bacterium]|nr:DUF5916 domain-containing protein [Longimicrobiales bacterium]
MRAPRCRTPTPVIVVPVLFAMAVPPASAGAQVGGGSDAEAGGGPAAPVASGVVDLQRLTGPVTLDGMSAEPAWAAIEPIPLTMYEPTYGAATDRRIELRVAYDDAAIYVAARFYHDDPADIRAFSLTRDRWVGDDGFGILLDTFNDNENAVRFVGLPLGARMDMTITGDGQTEGGSGTGPRGISWNTFWDLRTRITDEGWFGEIRVPFSSLRFDTRPDGSVVMGMMVYAYEPAEGRRWTFPAIPPRFPYTQVSAMQDVRMRDVAARNPVYVSPYGLTGSARTTSLAPAGDRFVGATDQQLEAGLDVKINPTPNLTLDLTANTDFAAVEVDNQQVNLTRFSLFFDEKRPFFQERAGIFTFETGAERGTLFYSRRIGLADGEPVRIHGGARLVGRAGDWDVGLIEMQTAAHGGLPSENFGVLRLRRRVWNANSFVGGMATSRVAGGGLYNITYGLDGQLRVLGDEYLTLKWLQTLQGGDAERDAAPDGLDAARVVVDWTRRRQEGLSYQHAFTWSGAGYDPAVGYEARSHFTRAQSDWNYQWYPGAESPFRRVWLGSQANVWVRHSDDRVDTGQLRPFVQVETKPGATLVLASETRYDDVPEAFSLADEAHVPAGIYWATEGSVELRAARGWAVRPNVTLRAGELFDGTRVGVTSDLRWTASRHLELGGGWEWNRVRFAARDQAFDAHLARVRADGALDVHLSMNAFLQYNSLTDQVTTNVRFRYNFSEGRDLWLVWNEGLNLERDVLGSPRLPFEDARTVTMKYTHTFVF